ncbi:calcium ion binding [Mactra antiquata]
MDSVLTTLIRVSLTNCMTECSKRPDCKSINYARHSLYCVLCGRSYDVIELGTNPKLVYVDIRPDSPTPVYRPDLCSGLSCLTGSVCESNQCQFKECVNETTEIEDAIIFGNINAIGDKRLLQCRENFTLAGPDTVVCQADGTWSPFGSCGGICGEPTYPSDLDIKKARIFLETGEEINTTDAQFIRDQTTFGINSEITFECPTATILWSVSTTCINSTWTPLGSCIPTSPVETDCRSNGQCSVFQSECGNGRCRCKTPKSYSHEGDECIDACTTVGHTFQRLEDTRLVFQDDEINYSFTLEQCYDRCMEMTNFDCLSFEFRHDDGKCVISRNNAASSTLDQSVGTTYFQRDCLT